MNPLEDPNHPEVERSIDRLVDGDLDDLQRRELLARIDGDPDGWRRCALAFLEDQAWRRALAGTPAAAAPSPIAVAGGRARPSARRLAMAASLLAATSADGLAIGGASRSPGSIVHDLPGALGSGSPTSPPGPGPIREVGWIDLVDGSSGESPPPRVPILAGPGLDDRWLRDQPPTVPGYVRAQWERQGYQVDERRRLVSVVLDDGRRVSIPVDEVELEYVGQHPF